jgi:transposase
VGYNFLAVERDQAFLMPPSLTEWLEEDHLAWFVLDAVEQMDLSAFHADYRADGWGRAAHDPKMMVALTLYGYCIGMCSSRAIERACRADVAFRVIAANQAPDHTTIARFRQRHEQALAVVFTESLRLCAQAGMVQVGLVAVDGTKMGCPAALAANRSKPHIDEQVAAMLAEAAEVDAREDARFGVDARGDEPPAQLRGAKARRERFAAAKAQLDAATAQAQVAHERHLAERAAKEQASGRKLRGRKPKPPARAAEAKANTSDPDSRIMKTQGGYVQGYNAQAVATEDQIVVAAEVTDEHNDHGQLHPMIAATTSRWPTPASTTGLGSCLLMPATAARTTSPPSPGMTPTVSSRPATPGATPAEERSPWPAARGRDPGGQDGPEGLEEGRPSGLPEATAHHRARLRPDQGRPRSQTVHAPREGRRGKRVETVDGHPQPAQALPADPDRYQRDPVDTPSRVPSNLLRGPTVWPSPAPLLSPDTRASSRSTDHPRQESTVLSATRSLALLNRELLVGGYAEDCRSLPPGSSGPAVRALPGDAVRLDGAGDH